ncbi:MAG: electron transfer flavoprotein subunit alpha/FixB family protein [Bacteroidia bacterium]
MSILVFAECIDGNFKKSSFEAVSYASKLATTLNTTAIAVSIGNVDEAKLSELARFGADKIINVNTDAVAKFTPEAYTLVLSNIASQYQAKVVVISNTYTGKSIAPRVAARLKAGIVSGVISQPDLQKGFVVKKGVFSGKAFSYVNLSTDIKILALTPNSFNIEEFSKTASIENNDGGVTLSDIKTESVNITRATGKIPLTEAELVVSAGRGMKGPENWHLVEELANTLGAATACSKPVSDMHWRPHSEHVGQTGITIKPNLYIAIGISGAIQHLAGVSSSKVIVAINKDPEAPFFKAADYGIVGDAFEVLPKITAAAKSLKAQTA